MIRLEVFVPIEDGATFDSSQRRAVESSIESLADTEYSLKHQVEERRKEVAEYESSSTHCRRRRAAPLTALC